MMCIFGAQRLQRESMLAGKENTHKVERATEHWWSSNRESKKNHMGLENRDMP